MWSEIPWIYWNRLLGKLNAPVCHATGDSAGNCDDLFVFVWGNSNYLPFAEMSTTWHLRWRNLFTKKCPNTDAYEGKTKLFLTKNDRLVNSQRIFQKRYTLSRSTVRLSHRLLLIHRSPIIHHSPTLSHAYLSYPTPCCTGIWVSPNITVVLSATLSQDLPGFSSFSLCKPS